MEFETGSISSCGKYFAFKRNGKVCIMSTNRKSQDASNEGKEVNVEMHNSLQVKKIILTKFAHQIVVLLSNGTIMSMANPHHTYEDDGNNQQENLHKQQCFDEYLMHISMSNDEKCLCVILKNDQDCKPWKFLSIAVNNLSTLHKIALRKNDVKGEVTCSLLIRDNKLILGTSDGCICVFNLEIEATGKHSQEVLYCNHKNPVTCLSISNDGNLLFSGSKGRIRRLWKMKGFCLELKHELHFDSLLEAGVTCAQFTMNDRFVIAGSKERCILIWDCEIGSLVASLYVYSAVLNLAVLPSNEILYTTELGNIALIGFREVCANGMIQKKKTSHKTSSSLCNIA